MVRAMSNPIDEAGGKPLPGKRMTLAQCRKVAPELNQLSDEDLLEMRDLAYEYAELIFDAWQEQKAGSKNPRESLTNEDGSGDA